MDTLSPDSPLDAAEKKVNLDRRPTMEQYAILSPCLAAYELSTSVFGEFGEFTISCTWIMTDFHLVMIHINNVKALNLPSNVPDPILSSRKFATINDLVNLQGPPSANRKGNGVTILLHGEHNEIVNSDDS